MKTRKFRAFAAIAAIFALAFIGCEQDDGNVITLMSVTANWDPDLQCTTELTLVFSNTVSGLSSDDITISGSPEVTKGDLSSINAAYTLPISDFTEEGDLTVTVVKSDYTIHNPIKQASIFYGTFIEMVPINAGTFQMGSHGDAGAYNDEKPLHSVTLSAFKIGKYQVTQAQYQTVMGTNPSRFKTAVPGEDRTPGKLPVEYVSWYDALVFCNKLSVIEGLTPAYSIRDSTDPKDWGKVPTSINAAWDAVQIVPDSNGYRLPTEAQWEYACRAGTTTAFNTGRDTITDDTAWYLKNSGNKTHKVGLKPPNYWDLYDMHGNVWEWCWDWWAYYSNAAQTDPTGAAGPGVAHVRILRGGSWNSGSNREDLNYDLRSAVRYGVVTPKVRDNTMGLRVARPSP